MVYIITVQYILIILHNVHNVHNIFILRHISFYGASIIGILKARDTVSREDKRKHVVFSKEHGFERRFELMHFVENISHLGWLTIHHCPQRAKPSG